MEKLHHVLLEPETEAHHRSARGTCKSAILRDGHGRVAGVPLRRLTLDDLHIEDERSFRHVVLYEDLKRILKRDGYRFRVLEGASYDRVLFLNLTFWDAAEQGDVLAEPSISADVVAHVAWHHVARRALGPAAPSADALLFAEAIASAFDLFLVGRLLGHAPDALFLATQVPAMAEAAEAAGLAEERFEALLEEVSVDPDGAFEELRELLFDAASTLLDCAGVDAAAKALARFDGHRFGPLLHHYELSNWILYARAHAAERLAPDAVVRDLDRALRAAPNALDHLERVWIAPHEKA
jgi:hypothetical protein